MIKSAILAALAALTVTATGGAVASADAAPVGCVETPSACVAEVPCEDTTLQPSDNMPASPDGEDGAVRERKDSEGGATRRGHRHGKPHFRKGDDTEMHRPAPLPYFDENTPGRHSSPFGNIRTPDKERIGSETGAGLPDGAAPFGNGTGADADCVTPTPCGIAEYVLSKITPEFIAVYENKVARAQIVSDMSEAEISLAASELNVSEQKLKALLLLQDLVSRTSKPVPVSALAGLSDGELFRLARRAAKTYAETLSESEREELKAEFKAALHEGKQS